jgi:hypothetical protein
MNCEGGKLMIETKMNLHKPSCPKLRSLFQFIAKHVSIKRT